MKPLAVDFAPTRRTSPWLLAVLCMALLTLAVQQARQAWHSHKQALSTEREVAALSKELDRLREAWQQAESRARIQPPYASDAIAIAKVAGFPLDRVLRSIEATQVPGIKMTALEVSVAEGAVRADLEFADQEALMRYLDEINEGEAKPRWTLRQTQVGTPGVASRATIASNWGQDDK